MLLFNVEIATWMGIYLTLYYLHAGIVSKVTNAPYIALGIICVFWLCSYFVNTSAMIFFVFLLNIVLEMKTTTNQRDELIKLAKSAKTANPMESIPMDIE